MLSVERKYLIFVHLFKIITGEMRKKLCPQCKIAAFYVKNESGERRLVYVTSEGEVVPKNPEESLDGFDVSEVFCLGCSWHGSPQRLVRY